MRVKKLVSILLAAVMLIGMIPMSAMAAMVPDNANGADLAEINLMISDKFGAVLPGTDGNKIDVKTATLYKNIDSHDNFDAVFKKNARTAADCKANVEKADMVFTPAQSGALDGIEPGSTVYLGVKAKLKNPSGTYKGVVAYGAYIKYDASKFEPITAGAETNKATYQNTIITNAMGTNTINKSAGIDADTMELTDAETVRKYRGNFKLGTASSIGEGDDANTKYLGIVTASDNMFYFPSETTWDFIIPLKVKEGASGTANFEVVKVTSPSSTNTEVLFSTPEYDGSVNLQDNANKYPISESNGRGGVLTSNDVSVTIAGPGMTAPSISTDATTITITPNEYCTFKAEQTTDDWTLTSDGAFNGGVKPSSVAVANGNVVLTFGKALQAETVTVTAAANAFATGVSTGSVSTTFTVVAAPNVAASVKTDGTVDITGVDSTMAYKIGGTDATGTYKNVSGSSLNIAGDDLTSLIADPVVYVKYQADTENLAVKKLEVPQQDTPDAPTVSYANETVTPGAAGVTFKIGAEGAEHTVANTNPVDISTEIPANGAGAKDLIAYVKAGNSKIQSQNVTSAGVVTARQAFAAAPASSDTDKKNGNTVLTNVTATDKYAVTAESVTNAPAWITSGVVNSTYTAIGAELKVPATQGQKVWLMKPADEAGKLFASAPVNVAGKGNDYGTLELNAQPEKDQKEIVVNIFGDKFTANPTSHVTVKKDGASVTVTSAACDANATQVTITLQDNLVAGSTYTIEMTADAVVGTKAPGTTAAGTALSVTISDKGYKPVLGTVSVAGKTVTIAGNNQVADGVEETIKLTPPVGYKITNVSIDESKASLKCVLGEEGVITYTNGELNLKFTGGTGATGPEEIPLNITLVALDVTAPTYTNLTDGGALTYGATNGTATPTSGATLPEGAVAGATFSYTLKSVAPVADGAVEVAADTGVVTLKNSKELKPGTYTVTVTATCAENAKTTDSTFTVTVKKKALAGSDFELVGGTSATEKTYDGTKNCSATMKVKDASLVTGDVVTVSGTVEFEDANVGTKDIIGYPTLSGDAAAYYALDLGEGNAVTFTDAGTINALEIPSTVVDDTFDFPQEVKDAIATATGAVLVGKDTVTTGIFKDLADAVVKIKALKLKFNFVTGRAAGSLTGEELVVGDVAKNDTVIEDALKLAAKIDGKVDADGNPDITKYKKGDTFTLYFKLGDLNLDNYDISDAAFTNALAVFDVNIKKSSSGGGEEPATTYTVSFEAGEHGMIVSGETEVTVEQGKTVTAVPKVSADSGYTFLGWSKDGKNTVDPTAQAINSNTTFTALYTRGFVLGDGNGKVRPNDKINRAEFTKMLVTASGKYDPQEDYGDVAFSDVNKNSWYAPYIACAVENGIVKGYSDNTFKPTDSITREEAAQMIYNALDNVTDMDTTDKITDFDSVANWAKVAVASLAEADIVKGYDDGSFKPKNIISRAEAATMICRVEGFDPDAKSKEEIVGAYDSPFTDLTKQSWSYVYLLYAAGELDDSYYA